MVNLEMPSTWKLNIRITRVAIAINETEIIIRRRRMLQWIKWKKKNEKKRQLVTVGVTNAGKLK